MMKQFLLPAIAAVFLAATSLSARADLVITAAGGSTGDVVQFENQFSGQTSFSGDTNQGANTVQFLNLNSSGTGYGPELLGTDGQGQADVVCTANCVNDGTGGLNGNLISGIEIKLPSPIGATTEIFNLDFGTGTVAIVAQDNFGNTFTDVLTPGSNFFRIDATPGTNEAITDTKIFESAPDSSGFFGFNDLKQPRIAACLLGVTCNAVVPVPEPSTLALFGGALLGLGLLRRKRRFTR